MENITTTFKSTRVGRPQTQDQISIQQHFSQNGMVIIELLQNFVFKSSFFLSKTNNGKKKKNILSFCDIYQSDNSKNLFQQTQLKKNLPLQTILKYQKYQEQFHKSKLLLIIQNLLQTLPQQVFNELEKIISIIIKNQDKTRTLINIANQEIKFINLKAQQQLKKQKQWKVEDSDKIKDYFNQFLNKLMKILIQYDREGKIQQSEVNNLIKYYKNIPKTHRRKKLQKDQIMENNSKVGKRQKKNQLNMKQMEEQTIKRQH